MDSVAQPNLCRADGRILGPGYGQGVEARVVDRLVGLGVEHCPVGDQTRCPGAIGNRAGDLVAGRVAEVQLQIEGQGGLLRRDRELHLPGGAKWRRRRQAIGAAGRYDFAGKGPARHEGQGEKSGTGLRHVVGVQKEAVESSLFHDEWIGDEISLQHQVRLHDKCVGSVGAEYGVR